MTGPKKLVIHGVGATISNQGTNPVFEVQDGAHLRLVGLSLSAMTGSGAIRCESAPSATPILDLVRTTLDNTNTVVLAYPCTLTVEESVLRTSHATAAPVVVLGVAKFNRTRIVGGGPLTAFSGGASVVIENSVLKNVGSTATEGTFSGGTFDVSYSTIVNSIVKCGSPGTNALTLSSSILINSVAGAPSDTLQGVNSCTAVKYTVAYPQASAIGATNVVGQMPQLKNVATDDYHLLSSSPAIDRGDPVSTNAVDFDGVPRPQGSGRDSGAFEYKP